MRLSAGRLVEVRDQLLLGAIPLNHRELVS